MRARTSFVLRLLAVLFVLSASLDAAAQAGDEERARTLFEEGKKLRDQGDWQGACARFEEAHAAYASGGTTFVVADCAERAGRLRDARALYEKVLSDPGSQDNLERLQKSREHIQAIDAKLAAAQNQPKPSKAPKTEQKPPESVIAPIPGAIVLGIGGAALIVGGVLGGLALSENGTVRDACNENVCPADQQDAYESAQAKALGADISFAIGGAAVVTGIVLLLVLKTDAPRAGPVAWSPSSVSITF